MFQNGFMYLFLNCWLCWVIAALWAFSSCREGGSSSLRPLIAVASLVGCFPGGSDGKVSACNVGDQGSDPWVGKIPWRRAWQPTPVFLPGEAHGQRRLEGCSPWGQKESDTTEQLTDTFTFMKELKERQTHIHRQNTDEGTTNNLGKLY